MGAGKRNSFYSLELVTKTKGERIKPPLAMLASSQPVSAGESSRGLPRAPAPVHFLGPLSTSDIK